MQVQVVVVILDTPIDRLMEGEIDTCQVFDTSLPDEIMKSTSFSKNCHFATMFRNFILAIHTPCMFMKNNSRD